MKRRHAGRICSWGPRPDSRSSTMPAFDRASLKEQLLREYAALLEERLPEGPLTLEEIETIVEELGRQQDRRLEELLIQEQTPPPDNQVACPHCHAPAPFKRLVPL